MTRNFFYAFILSAGCAFIFQGCSSSENSGEIHMKFDVLDVKVVAPSSYVMLGQKYRADIFLTAHSSSTPFELELDSSGNIIHSVNCKDGICTFESLPDSEGLYKVSGRLKLNLPGWKEPRYYPFDTEYMIARPHATIVPEEFALKRGQENKLNISIPGVAPSDLSVLVSNGTVTGENGHYSLKPGKEDKCMITVAYRNQKGEIIKLDQQEYSVIN
jgi:hypothetical protein